MKRFFTWFMCLLLLVAALPVSSLAAEELTEDQAIRREVRRIYTRCLESAEKESFDGFCGLLTSLQLYHMGITNGGDGNFNGNQQYDIYSAMPVTTGGYRTTAYSGQEYTLGEAMAAITRNGTRNVANILVGFETTTTEAGQQFGHALVIHRIVNGTVYYVENFATPMAGEEGNVIACSINYFVSFYENWTTFDGIVHFGNRSYDAGCQSFATELYIRTRFASNLRSQPSLLTENSCTRLRSLSAGELLHATAVYLNTRGEWYYQVDDGGRTGYVAANAVSVSQICPGALRLAEEELPNVAPVGQDWELTGRIRADNCAIYAMRMTLVNSAGEVRMKATLDVQGSVCDISAFNEYLDFAQLEGGKYTLNLYATAACTAVRGNGMETICTELPVHSQELTVGRMVRLAELPAEEEIRMPDGWSLMDGKWYYYQDNTPVTGWFTWLGVDYYLCEDGAATTGWAEIDGNRYYFSGTGARCVGWVTLEEGTYYWNKDGTPATGVKKIQGKLHCFDETGMLLVACEQEIDGVTYKIDKNGIATEVVKETPKN